MRVRIVPLLCAALVALLPLAAKAAEGSLEVYGNSAYVWRGQVLNDEPVLQPGLTVGNGKGLSFNTWANWNLTDNLGPDTKNEFNEVDLTASYALPIEAFDMEVGILEYLFPGTVTVTEAEDGTITAISNPDTREVYVSAALKTFLSPGVKVYRDIDEINGWYGVASIAHTFELTDKLSSDLTLSLGAADEEYNKGYFGVSDAALNDGNVVASLSYAFNDAFSVGGYLQYTRLLDDKIRDAAEDIYFNDGDIVVGGVSAGYSF